MQKKKSLAQEVCQKSDISILEHRIFFSTIFSKNLLRRKCIRRAIFWNVEYFFILQYFQRKAILSKKTVKNCFGGTFDHFLGKEASCLRN